MLNMTSVSGAHNSEESKFNHTVERFTRIKSPENRIIFLILIRKKIGSYYREAVFIWDNNR